MINKIGLKEAMANLQQTGAEFMVLFETGSLSVELYKPSKVDKQLPHQRDEVYLIASGRGKFQLESSLSNIERGDFLFVPAGATHRFLEFTEDFSTWVFFYGPEDGEGAQISNLLAKR